MSRVTRASAGRPTEATSPPGLLGPVTEIPQDPPAVQGYSCLCRWDRGVDQLFPGTWERVPGPAVLTSCPGRLGLSLRARSADLLSRTSRASVRGPVVSISFPGRLALWSEARDSSSCPI